MMLKSICEASKQQLNIPAKQNAVKQNQCHLNREDDRKA
jgi:hypothetical protein